LAFLFSAKESVYKAIYPIARTYIGFLEVEITIDSANRTFAANYLGDVHNNARLNYGVGRYIEFGSQLITLFLLYPSES
jgi:4'-phosphopantetheinyl transferase EntD